MHYGTLILLFMVLCWLVLAGFSVNKPRLLFLFTVSIISLINFSFFRGELLSRFSIPDFLFATLAFIFILRIAIASKEEIYFPKGPGIVFFALILSIFLSFFSIIPDNQMAYGGGEFLILLFGMMIFFLGFQYVDNEESLRSFLKAWMFSVVITAVICFIDMGDMIFAPPVIEKLPFAHSGFFGVFDLLSAQSITHDFFSPWPSRIMGPFRSNGQLASYSLTSFFVMLAYLHAPGHTRQTKQVIVILVWCLGIFTFLAMALRVLPSLFLGIGLYTIFSFRKSKKSGFFTILLLVSGLLFITAIAAANPQLIPKWMRDLNLVQTQSKTMGVLPLRAWALPAVWAAFCDRPFFGVGFGRFIQSDYINLTRGFEIHCTPLQFLGETGILGFLGYLFFMCYFAYLAFRNVVLAKSTEWKDFFIVLLIGVSSLPISYLYNRHLKERTFWLLLILIYGGYQFLNRRLTARLHTTSLN